MTNKAAPTCAILLAPYTSSIWLFLIFSNVAAHIGCAPLNASAPFFMFIIFPAFLEFLIGHGEVALAQLSAFPKIKPIFLKDNSTNVRREKSLYGFFRLAQHLMDAEGLYQLDVPFQIRYKIFLKNKNGTQNKNTPATWPRGALYMFTCLQHPSKPCQP